MKRTYSVFTIQVILIILIILSFIFSSSVFPLYANNDSDGSITLRLAHNQADDHPVGITLNDFASDVSDADNNVKIEVYPNGQFGSEQDIIEQVQTGAIDMAKVSAAALENFDETYQVYSLPYVFTSQEQYYDVMDNSESVHELYTDTEESGFVGITWYDAGQRSIYCKNPEPLEGPDDLKGLKIRVQPSQTSIDTINYMGGSATPMSYGEVYTGLQQGIIDCAENNETALITSAHGEVAKGYTYTSHQYTPDILIISTDTLEKLSDEQIDSIYKYAQESTETHKILWNQSVEDSIAESEALDPPVEFFEIDKQPFIDATEPVREDFANKREGNQQILDDFASYDKGGKNEIDQ